MVIAPDNTGRLVIKSIAVMLKAQRSKGRRFRSLARLVRAVRIVVRKLILPMMDLTPAKWRAKMAKSTEIPLWNRDVDNGG